MLDIDIAGVVGRVDHVCNGDRLWRTMCRERGGNVRMGWIGLSGEGE